MRKRLSAGERREQIIDGALGVFAVKGFTGSSTRDIALAAGLRSPTLLDHYFPSKLQILKAVIDRYTPAVEQLSRSEGLFLMPPRETLRERGKAYQSFHSSPSLVALMRIFLGEARRQPEFVREFTPQGSLGFLGFVSTYLSRQIEAGTLRRRDPMILALSFVGVLTAVAFGQVLTSRSFASDHPQDEFVTHSVEAFLLGKETVKR